MRSRLRSLRRRAHQASAHASWRTVRCLHPDRARLFVCRTTLGRQARPDRASPGRSRTRSLRAAVTRSRLRLRPHRNRLPSATSHHRLRLLHRQVRRPLHRPRRLRSAVRRSRAGARATGTTCIPGLPATQGASPKARERRRAVGRRASSRVGAGRTWKHDENDGNDNHQGNEEQHGNGHQGGGQGNQGGGHGNQGGGHGNHH